MQFVCNAGSAVMAVNAITTATALAISEVGRLPAIVQTILGASGTVTPDSVFNLLSLQTSGLPGLAAAPYINTLTNLSVSQALTATQCCCNEWCNTGLQCTCHCDTLASCCKQQLAVEQTSCTSHINFVAFWFVLLQLNLVMYCISSAKQHHASDESMHHSNVISMLSTRM